MNETCGVPIGTSWIMKVKLKTPSAYDDDTSRVTCCCSCESVRFGLWNFESV
jgi:hypothetical protein